MHSRLKLLVYVQSDFYLKLYYILSATIESKNISQLARNPSWDRVGCEDTPTHPSNWGEKEAAFVGHDWMSLRIWTVYRYNVISRQIWPSKVTDPKFGHCLCVKKGKTFNLFRRNVVGLLLKISVFFGITINIPGLEKNRNVSFFQYCAALAMRFDQKHLQLRHFLT